MVNRYKVVLVLGLVVMSATSSVWAQAGRSGDKGDPVQFSVKAEIESTDNRDSNVAEDSNFDMFLKPRVDIISDSNRTLFDFYYEPAYRYRTDPHPTQNDTQFQHFLGLNVKHQMGLASRVRLNERFAFTDDPSVQQGATTLRRDSSYTMNDIGGGLALDLGDNVQFDMYVANMIKRYKEDRVALESDEDRTAVDLKMMRFLQPTVGVYGSLGFAQYGYDQTGNADRGFDSVSVGAGIDRVLSDYVRAGAQVGFSMLSYKDSMIQDEDSPFVLVNGQFRPTPRVNAMLSVRYLVRNADVYPYSSQEAMELYTKVEWTGVERMKFSFWGAYRSSTYDDADVSRTLLAAEGFSSVAAYMANQGWKSEGEVTTFQLGSSLAYNVAERTSLNFAIVIEDVDSDVSESFTRKSARAGVTRTF